MVEEHKEAAMVLVGRFGNPRAATAVDGPAPDGVTDLEIDTTIKAHAILGGSRKLTVPYQINAAGRVLIFCVVNNGHVEPYRIIPLGKNNEALVYFGGSLKRKDLPPAERLLYAFRFLTSMHPDIALDAYQEFLATDYKVYRTFADKLDRKVLIERLEDPKTPAAYLSLYASLLASCPNASEHGALVRRLIDNPDRHKGSGVDTLLASYVIMQPTEGWRYLEARVLSDAAKFVDRYAALRALRILGDQKPEVVPRDRLISALVSMTEYNDIADLVINDLRRWRCWETTNQVLTLASRKTHALPIIRRAALRFALQSPTPQAARYVADLRLRDPEYVAETEELLQLEAADEADLKNGKK
jgi:hypothetical protein